MSDDLDNSYWLNRLHASCHDVSEQYHTSLLEEEEEIDRVLGFLTDLTSSSPNVKNLAAWISVKNIKALHGTKFLLPALVRFIFQNRHVLKLISESLFMSKALKEIPEEYLKDMTNAELLKEIQALQNQLWTMKGKIARFESSTLSRDDLLQSLELKQDSKESLEAAIKQMKERLRRFPDSHELQQRYAELVKSQTANKALQNEIVSLRQQLDHWTEQKCFNDKMTKINSGQSSGEVYKSIAKAIELMEQIQSELLPKLYALQECQSGLHKDCIDRQNTADLLSKKNGNHPKVTQGGEKSAHSDQKLKTVLLQLLKSRNAFLSKSAKSQAEDLCKPTDDASLSNYEEESCRQQDVSSIQKSYDKAKRQLTALDSEVIVLKKTRQMLEQQKDKDKEGLEIKFSAIESLEELEHQIEQTSQLLKQRKGELAPQVASLKAKRKELQTLEMNMEAVGRAGIRSETKEIAQRELALVKEKIVEQQEDIRELEIKVERLRDLCNSYNPDRIKADVVALTLEIKDLESKKRSLNRQEHVERIESWKQVTRLLENFLAVSQETTDSRQNQFEAEDKTTVLVID